MLATAIGVLEATGAPDQILLAFEEESAPAKRPGSISCSAVYTKGTVDRSNSTTLPMSSRLLESPCLLQQRFYATRAANRQCRSSYIGPVQPAFLPLRFIWAATAAPGAACLHSSDGNSACERPRWSAQPSSTRPGAERSLIRVMAVYAGRLGSKAAPNLETLQHHVPGGQGSPNVLDGKVTGRCMQRHRHQGVHPLRQHGRGGGCRLRQSHPWRCADNYAAYQASQGSPVAGAPSAPDIPFYLHLRHMAR